MDLNFIKNAEKITSFNLNISDFQSIEYKQEIQYLFQKHFFENFDIDSKSLDYVDKDKLNDLVSELKEENDEMFQNLHRYNIKGVGPGEITLYFLLNNSYLGGGSSAGIDLFVGDKHYEVKAVQVSYKENIAYDFKLGGTVKTNDIIEKIENVIQKYDIDKTSNEIKKSTINNLRNDEKIKDDFFHIESEFKDRAYDYFKDHEVIFINNSKSKTGIIESVQNVKRDDILIERVTSGTIKPMVYLDKS